MKTKRNYNDLYGRQFSCIDLSQTKSFKAILVAKILWRSLSPTVTLNDLIFTLEFELSNGGSQTIA